MPILPTRNKNDVVADHYVVPFSAINTDKINADAVREHRKEYGHQIEYLNALQKKFAAEKDYSSAKELKDVIKNFTQAEKAATLVIDWVEKATSTSTIHWPVDLYQFLDYEFNSIA